MYNVYISGPFFRFVGPFRTLNLQTIDPKTGNARQAQKQG